MVGEKGALTSVPGSPAPLSLPTPSREAEEEQVVGFLAATTGLRELALATLHLASV